MRLSVRSYLFFILAVAALAPIAYLGPAQIVRWRAIQRRDADEELRLASASLALAIGEVLDANVRAVSATAAQIGARGPLDPEIVTAMLRRYRERFPACLGVLVAGADARPMAFDPPAPLGGEIGDRPYYREMKSTGRTAISQLEIGRFTGVPTIHVCAPIQRTDESPREEPAGSLVAALSLEYLRELTADVVGPFGEMRALVLDGRSRAIVDSASEGRAALTDLSATAMYRPSSAGQTILRDDWDERGIAVRSASTQVAAQGLGWTVTVMRPTSTIEEHARHARTSTLIAVLGALGLGVTFAFVLSSWLARPIRRLARYARDVVADGDVAAPRPMRWDAREVADLTDMVGTMVVRLQSQANALRAREAEQVLLGRLRREMEIAERLQAGILPKDFDVPGFEVAALMKPAESVGGDYYDVLPAPSGCWIATGDVSGHGLNAGLVMLMLQSALGALATYMPDASPAALLKATNRLLVENIRNRLRSDDHVTMVLVRFSADGSFVLAGGHEPTVILRADAETCEVVENLGPWMGINLKSGDGLIESKGGLRPGDLVVLHSDGIVEAGMTSRNPFGLERLCETVVRSRARPARAICEEVIREAEAWTSGPRADDMTIVVVRYIGVA